MSASNPGSGASTPSGQAAPTSKKVNDRPTLAGANIKQRKGVAKAQAKFEPTVFRDDLLRALSTVKADDWEGYLRVLEQQANELDYRKYEAQLFELLIIGRLLLPGGNIVQDGAPVCPISVLGQETNNVKEIVGVLGKLIRRYKYLQKPLEELALPAILQYSNKFDRSNGNGLLVPSDDTSATRSGTSTPVATAPASGGSQASRPQLDKLAAFVALSITSGLVFPQVLQAAKKDHLVKDGTALAFLTSFCKAYLAPASAGGSGEGMDHLAAAFKKAGCQDLLEFFPLQRRSQAELQKEFKGKGLDKVADWYIKVAEGIKREEIGKRVREMSGDDEAASNEDIVAYLKDQQSGASPIPEQDLVPVLWHALMSHLDVSLSKDQLAEPTLRWVKKVSPVIGTFTTGARTEIALINAIQVHFYNEPALQVLFPRVVQLLYNEDVLSSQAIFYWYEKGAKPNGKQTFLKAMAPLVKAIKESEEDDDDDDDE